MRDKEQRPETRVAATRALANNSDRLIVVSMAAILADRESPTELTMAAVEALGRMGNRDALAAVQLECGDPDLALNMLTAMAVRLKTITNRLERMEK